MMKTILVIEDEPAIQEYLQKILTENDFSVITASDGAEALQTLHKKQPDMVILDLGLPKVSGEAIAAEIKKNYPDTQIVVLTAKNETQTVVNTLELGADDYVSKPFNGEELVARIKARFRAVGGTDEVLKVNDLELNTKTFEVKRGETQVKLTQKEFELLRYLMKNRGRVLTRDMILNKVWLYSPDIESRVVDVYVGYLRKKIDHGQKKKLLHSLRGFGYTIKE